MKRYLGTLAALCLIGLASCGSDSFLGKIETGIGVVTSATVTAKQIDVAANAFDATEATATTYLNYCAPKAQPAGCSDAVAQKLIPAIRAGRTDAEAAATDANGAPVDVSLYTALTTATTTLSAIEQANNIGAVK